MNKVILITGASSGIEKVLPESWERQAQKFSWGTQAGAHPRPG